MFFWVTPVESAVTHRTFQPPKPVLAKRAKAMRKAMTEPERKLWKALRWRLPPGSHQFRRHVPIGPSIVDFCCHANRLIIEVDGNRHGGTAARDAIRETALRDQGFRVLRFANEDIPAAIASVLDTAAAAYSLPDKTALEHAAGELRTHG